MNEIAEVSVAPADTPRATQTAHSDAGHADAGTSAGHTRSGQRTDTRAKIQQVAVELFTEHGYEGTSLREIAERLDVTKAALYYHFKSKEDIILSLVEDYQAQMDELIAWAGTQPRTPRARREILDRYMHIVAERDQVFRMLHQNQAVLSTMASQVKALKTAPRMLADQLCGPEAPLRERIRAMMTLGAISVGWMVFTEQVPDRSELSDIVCDLAAEFVNAAP
jgi:AcrR family transcriptional regulator